MDDGIYDACQASLLNKHNMYVPATQCELPLTLAQCHPSSIEHAPEQPSPHALLPSSQPSRLVTSPSPQRGSHVEGGAHDTRVAAEQCVRNTTPLNVLGTDLRNTLTMLAAITHTLTCHEETPSVSMLSVTTPLPLCRVKTYTRVRTII